MRFQPSKWAPAHDYVIILLDGEETTEGGIVLPDSAQEATVQALVEAVGPGLLYESGARRPMGCKRGDRVIVNLDPDCLDLGSGYHLIRDHNVAAVSIA